LLKGGGKGMIVVAFCGLKEIVKYLFFECPISDEASSGARGAPTPPTAAGLVEFLVFSF